VRLLGVRVASFDEGPPAAEDGAEEEEELQLRLSMQGGPPASATRG
jgi:hypothetical protein